MSELHCKNLFVSIANKQVCNALDLSILPGQFWGILGRNGMGKTTLLHTIAGIRNADSGSILLNHKNITGLSRKLIAKKMGLLLQQSEEAFPSSVLDTVLCGRHPHIGAWQWENENDLNIAIQALKTVQMSDMQTQPIDQLSGGERQRVAIASLLSQAPDIYLLDEPNSHLDLNYQIQLLQHFEVLSSQKKNSVIMTIHDINLAQRFCTHILFLYGNGDYEAGPVNALLTTEKLEKLFGHPIKVNQQGNTKIFWPE